MLRKIEGRSRRGRQDKMDGINSMDRGLSKWGDSEGQRSLECRSSWGCKELDTT